MAASRTGSAPLSGADWFLATAERMMLAAGQGEHLGLTVLRLGPGLDVAALRLAAARLAAASPIAAARLHKPILGIPRWVWRADARPSFPVEEHREPLGELCARRLNESSPTAVRFDVLGDGYGSTVVLRWRHLMLDAKGAELLLAEIARLAENADSPPPRAGSSGPITPRPSNWRTALGEAERFKDHFYALARTSIRSLGGALPRPGAAAFFVEEFSAAETARITARATTATHELFQMGWFLAAAMRVHHAVLCRRGEDPGSYQSNCPVQERKRGARHPIWQNHVSQLFFRLLPAEIAELGAAARNLQGRSSHRRASGSMWPSARRRAFYAGCRPGFTCGWCATVRTAMLPRFSFPTPASFSPSCGTFCGAPIEHGWHVPSVCQPPGTGVFFSRRGAQLTATISWREGALRAGELDIMCTRLRADLLES